MSLQLGTMGKLVHASGSAALALVVALLLLVSAGGDAKQHAVSRVATMPEVARTVKAVADFRRGQWSSESALWRLADPLDYRESTVQRSVPTCSSGDAQGCGIRSSF
jgi:hypothetical protein